MTTPYRVLVTGSRDWRRHELVCLALDAAFCEATNSGRPMTLVHGACPTGADDQAADWANYMISRDLPVKVEAHPAEDFGPWPACGPFRNKHMVSLGADACLAFIGPCTSPRCRRTEPHPSHGASHTARLAEQAGIPVRRFTA
jgi:hypothetical protein